MGSLSQLAEKCQRCAHVDKCDHKRMEACAYLDADTLLGRVSGDAAASASAPLLRETIEINIGGINTVVYKDEIDRIIRNSIMQNFLRNC